MTTAPPPASAALGTPLRFVQVEHRYGDHMAVAGVDLQTQPGELIALLGPSGCGKTTLLRIVAGLLRQTRGHVQLGERIVDDLPTAERGVGIVFQNYALFPHMTVEANVAYGLRARGVPAAQCQQTAAEMLAMVQMSAFHKRYPRELSGGQQQRVALARTLAVRPQILLLDEPLAALDKNLRLDMQIEIRRIQRELGITTLLVTHDQEEAMSMADRIGVMNAGVIEQYAAPEDLYDQPSSLFVAQFVGTANLVHGRLQRLGDGYAVQARTGGTLALRQAAPCSREGDVVLAVRPEHLALGEPAHELPRAQIKMVLPLGPTLVYELHLPDGTPVKVTVPRHADALRHEPGQTVGLALRPGAPCAVFLPPPGDGAAKTPATGAYG